MDWPFPEKNHSIFTTLIVVQLWQLLVVLNAHFWNPENQTLVVITANKKKTKQKKNPTAQISYLEPD